MCSHAGESHPLANSVDITFGPNVQVGGRQLSLLGAHRHKPYPGVEHISQVKEEVVVVIPLAQWLGGFSERRVQISAPHQAVLEIEPGSLTALPWGEKSPASTRD